MDKMSCSKIQRDKKSRRLRTTPCDLLEHTNGKGRHPKPLRRTYEPRAYVLICLLYVCNLYTANVLRFYFAGISMHSLACRDFLLYLCIFTTTCPSHEGHPH